MTAREAYSLYVEHVVEGANEADGPLSCAAPQRLPQARWREGHLELRHAEGRQRVDGGIDHGGRDADAPGLPHALGAERVERRGRARLHDLNVRHLVGARDRIVHERASEELAVLVVDDLLHQHLAKTLREAAVELP